ncbi:hypothetical protein IC620_09705 [Hazenella sp. IB182357]|uniref:Uncharacterized protein n=1 Tax=Polycladospora coralii TaxID=2771432 RepID=A0A926RU86_9BACL|nr:hypothetical protein [Polycladospora coralii]MBD1372628.1 hypothetical protein [Polycladospora coralii]
MKKLVMLLSLLLFLPACSLIDEAVQRNVASEPSYRSLSANYLKEDVAKVDLPYCWLAQCLQQGELTLKNIRKSHGNLSEHVTIYRTNEKHEELAYFMTEEGKLNNIAIESEHWNYNSKHERTATAIWDLWNDIIPDPYHQVDKLYLFQGGDFAAYVNMYNMRVELGVNIKHNQDQKQLTTTLVHEFGHILTLNQEQFTEDRYTSDQQELECPAYFDEWSDCPNQESYLYSFYNKFWKKIETEWKKKKIETSEARQTAFYNKYRSQFVSEYATTSPVEDIAESFQYFIFSPKPTNLSSIKSQKIAFFYEYPELVAIRADVLARVEKRF